MYLTKKEKIIDKNEFDKVNSYLYPVKYNWFKVSDCILQKNARNFSLKSNYLNFAINHVVTFQ